MLCAFRNQTRRHCPNCLSVWAREASGQSSSSQPSAGLDHPRQNSGGPFSENFLGFDSALLSHARRRKFVAPAGFTISECWDRIDEILVSEKLVHKSVRLGDLLILSNVVLSNDASTVSMSAAEIVTLVNNRVVYRDRFPTVFLAIQFLRFTCNSNTCLTPSLILALTNTLQLSSSVIKLSELAEFFHLLLEQNLFAPNSALDVTDLLEAFQTRLRACEPFPETARGPVQYTVMRILSDLSSKQHASLPLLLDIGSLFMTKVRGADCPEFLALLVDAGRRIDPKQMTRLVRKFPQYSSKQSFDLQVREDEGVWLHGLFDEPVFFHRLLTDMQSKPAYMYGEKIMYYKNDEWHISRYPDLRPYKRIAFLPEKNLHAQAGWRVWDKDLGFVSSLKLRVNDEQVFSQPVHDSDSAQLGICVDTKTKWSKVIESESRAVESNAIAELFARVKVLEKLHSSSKLSPMSVSNSVEETSQLGEQNGVMKRLSLMIDAMGGDKEMDTVGIVDPSFEASRVAANRSIQIEATRNLVGKKFAKK